MSKTVSRRQALTGISLAGAAATVLSAGRAQADQPHMEAALEALKTADRELKEALPDKGGHRAKAISLVKQAIVQVERGISFAAKH